MKKKFLIASLLTLSLASAQTVTIGNQVWSTKNLDVSTFRNGDSIPQVKTIAQLEKAANNKQPAWCYYNNDASNGSKYGKLYNWYAVSDPRGLAPLDWHIASDSDWTKLTDFLGGKDIAAKKIKSKLGWSKNGNGTNSSGFNGLPGGARGVGSGAVYYLGDYGYWWTSTEYKNDLAWYRYIYFDYDYVKVDYLYKGECLSVRCVKD